MSRGTAHLLTALFVAAAMGYPSRRSATDLDATPRTTVTFDGKGTWVMVVALGSCRDWVWCTVTASGLCQVPGAGGSAQGGGYRGPSSPLGSRNRRLHGWLVLGARSRCALRDGAGQRHLPKSQRQTRTWREPALASPQPWPAAPEECPELGIPPGLGSHGPHSQQGAFFCDFLQLPLGSWPPASAVSASPAVSSWLGHPHDFVDLVSEAQLSSKQWRGLHLQVGCPFLPRQCLLSEGSYPPQLPPGSQAPRDILLLQQEGPSLAWGPSSWG